MGGDHKYSAYQKLDGQSSELADAVNFTVMYIPNINTPEDGDIVDIMPRITGGSGYRLNAKIELYNDGGGVNLMREVLY